MEYLAAGVIVSFALVVFFSSRISRRILIALALVFVAIGLGSVVWMAWRYAPANTQPASVPVSFAHAGEFRTPPFRTAITGVYEILLQFDRQDDIGDFRCVVGEPGFEPRCHRRQPELDIAWNVLDNGQSVARGASDWNRWNAHQAALDPADAEKQRAAFKAFQATQVSHSNHWPLAYTAAQFRGEAGHSYVVELDVRRPAPSLAPLHPKLVIGLAGAATKGLGAVVIVFALVCVFFGATLLLSALRRGTT